jgi:eukaryotic-like serine/threonine-protein kinase
MAHSEIKLPGRYTIMSRHNDGGSSEVLICQDNILNRDVAIKLLNDGWPHSDIQSELIACARCASKHVVSVLDYFELDRPAVVFEYLPKPLPNPSDLKKEDRLPVLWQIAEGLSHIHANGLVHRDVKPNNIRIGQDGTVKLIDMGFATFVDESTINKRGTATFRPPEFYTDNKIDIQSSADTYSFGVLAWFMLSGEYQNGMTQVPPFSRTVPSSFSELNYKLPKYLHRTLDSCLHINPDSRPKMAEVEQSILRYILQEAQVLSFYYNGKRYKANSSAPVFTITIGENSAQLKWLEGYFYIQVQSGYVYVNNTTWSKDVPLPKSGVLTVGDPNEGANRHFLPFDTSNPDLRS